MIHPSLESGLTSKFIIAVDFMILKLNPEPIWVKQSKRVNEFLFILVLRKMNLKSESKERFTSSRDFLNEQFFISLSLRFFALNAANQIKTNCESFTIATARRIIIRQFFFKWHNKFPIFCCSTRHAFEYNLKISIKFLQNTIVISEVQKYLCAISKHPDVKIFCCVVDRMMIRSYDQRSKYNIKLDKDCSRSYKAGRTLKKRLVK